ncbi:MAG: LPS assembly protein LptD [Acidobacteria bacterium]|nr:LPS assembly protein LptD [Acidobacteriota bacterium]
MARSFPLAATLALLPAVVLAQAQSDDAASTTGVVEAVRSIAEVFANVDWQSQVQYQADGSLRLERDVQLGSEREGWQLFAEEAYLQPADSRITASGNVVFETAEVRIAAERVEFDMTDGSAVFHDAYGSVNMRGEVDQSMFGAQEPEMFFFGEQMERTGPRSYRLTRGAFTSCVQPTPRWEVVSSTIDINLDEHLLLRNAVIEVKGVPVFYLPWMFYPIQEEGRATGILMPTYGTSTYHGSSLANAFFWAIGRSQDATAFHDYFMSSGGHGLGGEYRYARGGLSSGYGRYYFLNEPGGETSYRGVAQELPQRRSYQMRGQATQEISEGWNARGQVDYFSDVTVQQTYHANIYQAANTQRAISGNVSGQLGNYQLSGTFDLNETFFGERTSSLWGAGPRISLTQGKSEVPGLPMYYSFTGEFAELMRIDRSTQGRGEALQRVSLDSGLRRFDLNPTLQIPFTRWPFLIVDSTAQWRGTYWTESVNPHWTRNMDPALRQIEESIGRSFVEFQSRATRPSFVKIWDTPNSGYSERMKHVIEPWTSVGRVSAVDNFDQIVQLEGIDAIRGSVTQFGYGIDTRLYARVYEGGPESVPREILSASIMQTYYTDDQASLYDPSFRTSFNNTSPNNYSPVSILVRASPSQTLGATLRAEIDSRYKELRTIGAEGTYQRGDWLEARGGWSQRYFIEELSGFNDPRYLDHYVNGFVAARTRGGTVRGSYEFNYDVKTGRYLQQRIMVEYHAQCCGVRGEYQFFNFAGLGHRAVIPQDRRFNLSFTLAGLGTFANVLGAFGGGAGGVR